MPAKAYEFPTGYSAVFGAERYQVGEHMFFNNPQNVSQPKIIMALVSDALRTCDPELRGVLASNVVLTGGGSLLTGVLDRLNMELGRMGFAHVRLPLSSSPCQVQLTQPTFLRTGKDPRSRQPHRAAIRRLARRQHPRQSRNFPPTLDQQGRVAGEFNFHQASPLLVPWRVQPLSPL